MRKVLVVIPLLALMSCIKDNSINPFDTDYPTPEDSLDITTFAGIHQHILEPRCANPVCHDGTFEPDFRTVESSYNTMVYHPVTKNTPDEDFTYRVVPGDVNNSWLSYRLITDDDTLGIMPLYGNKLSWQELTYINDWIENGALDVNGNAPQEPNLPPELKWYVAFNGNGIDWNKRIDTNRNSWSSPFYPYNDSAFTLLFRIVDDHLGPTEIYGHELHISMDMSFATQTTLYPAYAGTGDYFYVVVPPSMTVLDSTYYMRYQVEDSVNVQLYPGQDAMWWQVSNYSFVPK